MAASIAAVVARLAAVRGGHPGCTVELTAGAATRVTSRRPPVRAARRRPSSVVGRTRCRLTWARRPCTSATCRTSATRSNCSSSRTTAPSARTRWPRHRTRHPPPAAASCLLGAVSRSSCAANRSQRLGLRARSGSEMGTSSSVSGLGTSTRFRRICGRSARNSSTRSSLTMRWRTWRSPSRTNGRRCGGRDSNSEHRLLLVLPPAKSWPICVWTRWPATLTSTC